MMASSEVDRVINLGGSAWVVTAVRDFGWSLAGGEQGRSPQKRKKC